MLVTQVREKKLFFFTSSFPSLSLSPGFSFISVSPFFSPLSRQNLNNNKKKIFLHDPDHNMVEICNCGLIPVVPVQEGRSALSKRSSIDMGQHARAAAAARLVPGGAASLPAPIPSPSAQVTVCGPAGCFPARPAPLSIPECGPCCVVAGGGGGAAAATAVAADCTSSGAAASASASASAPPLPPAGVAASVVGARAVLDGVNWSLVSSRCVFLLVCSFLALPSRVLKKNTAKKKKTHPLNLLTFQNQKKKKRNETEASRPARPCSAWRSGTPR